MTFEPTTHTPRTYQTEAFEWSYDHCQAVVCLPTGTGKTLVGCLWACELLNTRGAERILVVEPSRFLVEQTHAYYDEHTNIPATKVDGTTPPNQRKGAWNDGRVVVTTPQTAVNDAAHREFDAVIVDECHHTVGQHACAQLLADAEFNYKLGLSATIPTNREGTIEGAIGPVRRQSWTDIPDAYVPDWEGTVYDTPYPQTYRDVVDELEAARLELEESRLAGLPSLAIRMLCRDGALALAETLGRETVMSDVLGDRVRPLLADCPPVHKLDACRQTLAAHDFEKAVVFVDRVAVARRLVDELESYTAVPLLGRLNTTQAEREAAFKRVSSTETDVVVATAAGEEGIDLPAADLLVVWSNVVSSVRFVQRLGRVMRPDGCDAPRKAVYLGTPNSPDYRTLKQGIHEAERVGLDVTNIDLDGMLAWTPAGRVRAYLDSTPSKRSDLEIALNQPASKVDDWLRTTVREGDVFYLYNVPADLNEWRKAANGMAKAFGYGDPALDEKRAQRTAEAARNNFSPGKADRYYLQLDDIDIIESDFPRLVDGDGSTNLKLTFGPSHEQRGRDEVRGDVKSVVKSVIKALNADDTLYGTVSYSSYSPTFSIQMQYQGSATEPVIRTIIRNADAIVTQLEERLA